MKKKALSLLLALLLCLTQLPLFSRAAAEETPPSEIPQLPASLEIQGEDAVSIPGTAQYLVHGLVENELFPLKDDLIRWSVENAPAGVSIEPSSGFLTVTDNARAGSVTLSVTYGSAPHTVSASKSVTLTAPAPAPALTITGKPDSVVYGDTFTLTATVEHAASGGEWLWESSDPSVLGIPAQEGSPSILSLSAEERIAHTCSLQAYKRGAVKLTATYFFDGVSVQSSLELSVAPRTITVRADDKRMTVGDPLPELTVSYGGFAAGDSAEQVLSAPAAASAAAAGETAGRFPITVETAPTLKEGWEEKYTLGAPEAGVLTVEAKPASGGRPVAPVGSSGTKTETTTDPDGSTTRTETKKDGTVTVKTTYPDGSTVETVTRPDGSSTTQRRSPEGSVGTLTKDAYGRTSGDVQVSEKALEAAAAEGSAVKLPLEADGVRDPNEAAILRITLPQDAGETTLEIPVRNLTSGTVIVIVHEDGTEEILKRCIPTETGLQFTASGSIQIKILENSKDYTDSTNHWSRDDVSFVCARELFNGVGGGSFGVNDPMTRGMVNTVLARLAGQNTTPTDGQPWYALGNSWAKQTGVSDGTNPESPVTREQLAAMLYRSAGSPEVTGSLSFSDAGETSPYAQDALLWAVQKGILNGTDSGRIAPSANADRAQVAAMLARYLKNQ